MRGPDFGRRQSLERQDIRRAYLHPKTGLSGVITSLSISKASSICSLLHNCYSRNTLAGYLQSAAAPVGADSEANFAHWSEVCSALDWILAACCNAMYPRV
jgi:hypothetical protein